MCDFSLFYAFYDELLPVHFRAYIKQRAAQDFITSAKEDMLSALSVCLSVCLSACPLATLPKTSKRICMKWQWATEQMITFWWRSGSPSGYSDCFPDSSLLGDTESGINRLRCATLQCTACTSGRHHSNYDVITSPAHDRYPRQTCHGGGMHSPSVSSYILRES